MIRLSFLYDISWIARIDHRVSSALVYFLLLLLLNRSAPRRLYPLRALLSLTVMCLVSWGVRYVSDEILPGGILQGVGYMAQVALLYGAFLLADGFCYQAKRAEIIYNSILALTIFKIAWNGFKMGGSLLLINGVKAPWSQYSIAGSLVSYLVYTAVCLVCALIYRELVGDPPHHAKTGIMAALAVVLVLCQMVLEFCGHMYTVEKTAQLLYYLCALLYSIMNYALLLMLPALDSFRHENRSMHDFISNKMRYYEMSREGIVSLQTKCHDLKHQISAIRSEAGKASFDRYLDELENSIDEYATVIECGNPTVDIVLTEKNILCLTNHVKFSYMIDGSLFSFLTEREIYSLFGNALDNALEAASRVQDPAGRLITLKSNLRGDMVVLQVENTFPGEMALAASQLPQTTKTGSGHGFGLRSMERIAERHGGAMSLRAEDGVFRLSVVLRRETPSSVL